MAHNQQFQPHGIPMQQQRPPHGQHQQQQQQFYLVPNGQPQPQPFFTGSGSSGYQPMPTGQPMGGSGSATIQPLHTTATLSAAGGSGSATYQPMPMGHHVVAGGSGSLGYQPVQGMQPVTMRSGSNTSSPAGSQSTGQMVMLQSATLAAAPPGLGIGSGGSGMGFSAAPGILTAPQQQPVVVVPQPNPSVHTPPVPPPTAMTIPQTMSSVVGSYNHQYHNGLKLKGPTVEGILLSPDLFPTPAALQNTANTEAAEAGKKVEEGGEPIPPKDPPFVNIPSTCACVKVQGIGADRICRDHCKGTCTGNNCNLVHAPTGWFPIPSQRCHEFLSQRGCQRTYCKHFHGTEAELQELFSLDATLYRPERLQSSTTVPNSGPPPQQQQAAPPQFVGAAPGFPMQPTPPTGGMWQQQQQPQQQGWVQQPHK